MVQAIGQRHRFLLYFCGEHIVHILLTLYVTLVGE